MDRNAGEVSENEAAAVGRGKGMAYKDGQKNRRPDG